MGLKEAWSKLAARWTRTGWNEAYPAGLSESDRKSMVIKEKRRGGKYIRRAREGGRSYLVTEYRDRNGGEVKADGIVKAEKPLLKAHGKTLAYGIRVA